MQNISKSYTIIFIYAFIQCDLHRLIHKPTLESTMATASSSGAVRVKGPAQGHINTQLGGAGDRTSNLSVTTSLPPELS